jgi:hypothetical protein
MGDHGLIFPLLKRGWGKALNGMDVDLTGSHKNSTQSGFGFQIQMV